ncbi:ABC transporter substrate-binding protein [uncultured Desulfobacter sp.]|uniref:ABC transporter substrate-binding protein n=1 Tax=uncultured Desulfobacter sp. TaxID=240139 RepID=UPI002AA656A4|nr:ABC transporter substrate-binding protein [uncultured Desulfobacter sp.]
MMKYIFRLLIVEFFVFALLFSGNCQAQTSAAWRIVIDCKGNQVKIPLEVKRVCANGALAQMVLMLGAGDHMVATGRFVATNPMVLKIFPEIKNVPVIYGAPGGKSEIQLETLVRANPDVLFGRRDQVLSLGIPCPAVSLLNFEDIKYTVRMIGDVLGGGYQAKSIAFCEYYDAMIEKIRSRTADISKNERPRVYYAGGEEGLNTEGRNTISYSWITAGGGINVAAEHGVEGSRKVTIESIIKWNPDIIISNSYNGKQTVANSEQWKDIRAVVDGRVYQAPRGVYLWSVRSGEGVLQVPWAAKHIHPELFTDLNIQNEVRQFYARFYGYDITEGEIEEILHPAN